MFLGSKVWPVRGAENFTVICLDSVGSLTSHNPFRPPWPLTGIALPFFPLYSTICTRLRGLLSLLTEMSTGNIKTNSFWGVKCGRCLGLTTL
jgi:hypothetical protein